MAPRYFFLHMQKTGGTALFQRLREHFGVEGVYPTPDDQGTPQAVLDVDFVAERVAAAGDRIRVVTGHLPLCTTVERTLSFLRHQRKVDADSTDRPLEEIYEDGTLREGLIRDHMVRMLSLTVDEMVEGALTRVEVDDARLARALQALEGEVDLFGLQEHFEDFCAELSARYGWDLGQPRFANRTFEDIEVSDAFRARIADDNAADVALYEAARVSWQRRRSGAVDGHQTIGT
jgi:hypothetical protein